MKRWNLLEEVTTPDGSKMALHEHDGEYVLRVNGRELMSTRRHSSEERLAEVACARLVKQISPRTLIGGLGLSFTLKAALATLPPGAEVVVAELLASVVEWNKNPVYNLGVSALADPRTKVVIGDVFDIIARSPKGFDAIMLDADNNTTAMNSEGNRKLYRSDGLALVNAALRPGGVVAYWSAGSDPLFAKQLGRSGFDVKTERTPAFGDSGSRHTILIATKI